MKTIFALLCLLTTPLTGFAQVKNENLVMVCGDNKVLLVDYQNEKDSIPVIVWNWDAHQATDLPSEYRTRKFNTMDTGD